MKSQQIPYLCFLLVILNTLNFLTDSRKQKYENKKLETHTYMNCQPVALVQGCWAWHRLRESLGKTFELPLESSAHD